METTFATIKAILVSALVMGFYYVVLFGIVGMGGWTMLAIVDRVLGTTMSSGWLLAISARKDAYITEQARIRKEKADALAAAAKVVADQAAAPQGPANAPTKAAKPTPAPAPAVKTPKTQKAASSPSIANA